MNETFGLEADVSDPIGRFKIVVLKPNTTTSPKVVPEIKTLSFRDSDEVIAVETGFRDKINGLIGYITLHIL